MSIRQHQQLCEQFCRSKRAVVYGVQYGHECWCGDHMDYDQYGPGQCDYRCAGDMHTTCGGCECTYIDTKYLYCSAGAVLPCVIRFD